MEISRARKLVELTKDKKKVLVTLYDGGQISTCIEEEDNKFCETCQGDEELCRDYVEHLKSQGYEATEVELGELGVEVSLPKFLEQRETRVRPEVALGVEPKSMIKEPTTEAEETETAAPTEPAEEA